MDNIKNCPFCGEKGETDTMTINGQKRTDVGWVGCRKCKVFIDRGKRIALALWNKRVPATAESEDHQ